MNYKDMLSYIEDNFTTKQIEKFIGELGDVLENRCERDTDTIY